MSLAHYDHIAQVVAAAHKQQPYADDEALAEALSAQHPTMPFTHLLAWVKQYRPAKPQQQPTNRSKVMPMSNNAAPKQAQQISKSNPRQYAKTTATLRKQTVNCAVFNSRALGSTYIPLVNFPEGEEIPNQIEITITGVRS